MKKINFVGAGPGAVDLITVRGANLLKEADVVIYAGSLVNPDILQYVRKDCEIFNSAFMTLEEVMEVMISSATADKNVVRLHTGEPSIYGAIKEQMDILDQKQIEYSLCPGISACFGAAASMNLEYTLPGVSQTLIITRAEGKTLVPEKEGIKNLAGHQSSMAIYLSAGMLKKVQDQLIEGGYSPETPAAIIYKATWPEEKTVYCNVGQLKEAGEANAITNTALILVGDAIEPHGYERSKLYSPDFSTEFRKAVE